MERDASASVRWPVAAALLLLAGALVGLKLWAAEHATRAAALHDLRTTPDGELAVLLGSRIFIGDPDRGDARIVDLAPLDGDEQLADFAFFPNGDLLIWRTPGELGRFGRLRSAMGLSLPADGDLPPHLARCDLVAMTCERHLVDADPPRPPFGLAIAADGTVFVADATRHRVIAYGPDGHRVGTFDDGLAYPNGVWLRGERVYIANTDAREIVSVRAHAGFRGSPRRQPFEAGSPGLPHLPIGLAAAGDRWWVVTMGQRAMGIAVYALGENWDIDSPLALGAGARPAAVHPHDRSVYVADSGRFRVARFAPDGSAAGTLEWPRLTRELGRLESRHTRYTWLGHGAWTGLMALVCMGFVIGYRQGERARGTVQGVPLPAIGLTPESPDIQWLRRDRKHPIRGRRTILLLVFGVLLVSALLVLAGPQDPSAWKLAGLMGALAGLLWLMSGPIVAARIGVHGDWLVLDSGRRVLAGRGDAVVYSPEAYAIDDIAVPIGRGSMQVYCKEDLEKVEPILKRARAIPRGQMQLKILRAYPGAAIGMAGTLLGMLAWLGYYGPYL